MAGDDDTIYVDVVAKLDEASADEAAGRLRDKFKDAGAGAEEWIKGLGSKLEDEAKAASGKLKDVFGSDAFKQGVSDYAQAGLEHLGTELGAKLHDVLFRGAGNLGEMFGRAGLDADQVEAEVEKIKDAVGSLASRDLTDKLSGISQLLGSGSRAVGAGGLADTLDGLTSVLSGVKGLKGLREGDIEGGVAGLQALLGGTNAILGNKPGTGLLGQAEGVLAGVGSGAAIGAGLGSIIPIPGLSTGVGAGIGAGVGGLAALIAQLNQQPQQQEVPQDVLDAINAAQQSDRTGAIDALVEQVRLSEAQSKLQSESRFAGLMLPGQGVGTPVTPLSQDPNPLAGGLWGIPPVQPGPPAAPGRVVPGGPEWWNQYFPSHGGYDTQTPGVPSGTPPPRAPAAVGPPAPAAAAGGATGSVSITATTASISAGTVNLSGGISMPGIGSAGALSPSSGKGWPRAAGTGTVGGGGALHFAGGGEVTGPGTIGQDSVPAWLAPGERVLTAEQNSFYDAAQRADTHNIAGFAPGGETTPPPPPPPEPAPPPPPEAQVGGGAGVGRPATAPGGTNSGGAAGDPPPAIGDPDNDPLGPNPRGLTGGQRTKDGIQDNSIGYGQGFMPTGSGLIGFAEQAPALAGMAAAAGVGSVGPAAGAGVGAGALAGVASAAWSNLAVPEINEAIQQGVRMGATAIEAPFETFSVGGKSLLSGWPQKLLGGVMGQIQNFANVAGNTQAPLSPQGDDQPSSPDGGAGGLNSAMSGAMNPQGTRNDPVHVRTMGDPGQAGAAASNGMNWVGYQSAHTP